MADQVDTASRPTPSQAGSSQVGSRRSPSQAGSAITVTSARSGRGKKNPQANRRTHRATARQGDIKNDSHVRQWIQDDDEGCAYRERRASVGQTRGCTKAMTVAPWVASGPYAIARQLPPHLSQQLNLLYCWYCAYLEWCGTKWQDFPNEEERKKLMAPVWRYWRSSWIFSAEEDIWGKIGHFNGFATACRTHLCVDGQYNVPTGDELPQAFGKFPAWLTQTPWKAWDVCERDMKEYIRRGGPVVQPKICWSELSARLNNERCPLSLRDDEDL